MGVGVGVHVQELRGQRAAPGEPALRTRGCGSYLVREGS